MLFYVRVHGLEPDSHQFAYVEYPCHDLLDALNICKSAVCSGYMAELLIEQGN